MRTDAQFSSADHPKTPGTAERLCTDSAARSEAFAGSTDGRATCGHSDRLALIRHQLPSPRAELAPRTTSRTTRGATE